MKNKIGLIKRLAILAVLVVSFGFVAGIPTAQATTAAPCCSQCPLDPEDFSQTPQEFCTDQCGAGSGTCYNECLNGVYSCWAWCIIGC